MPHVKKRLLLSGAIIFGALFVCTTLLIFLNRDITRRAEAAHELKKQIVTNSRIIGSLVELKEDSDEARKALPSLYVRLPTRDDLLDFPKEVVALAKAESVEATLRFLEEVKPKDETPGGLLFSMTFSGSYSALQSFFMKLESLSHYTRIHTFDMVAGNRGFDGTASGQVFTQ